MGAMVGFLAIFCESADRDAVLNQIGAVSAQDNLDGTLGLDEVQGPVLLVGLGVQALAEYSKQRKEDDDDFTSVEYTWGRCPGDLGFDPLSLCAVSNPNGFELKGVNRPSRHDRPHFLPPQRVRDQRPLSKRAVGAKFRGLLQHSSPLGFRCPFPDGPPFFCLKQFSAGHFLSWVQLCFCIIAQVMDVPLSRRNLGRLSL